MLTLVLVLVGLALLVAVLIVSFLFHVVLLRAQHTTRPGSSHRSAAVVVLGDIGRSPRMCYHVSSLAAQGWRVSVVAYSGVGMPPNLRRANIKHHLLRAPPRWITGLPKALFILAAPFKLLWQTYGVFVALAVHSNPPPELILVQNPPALPTLFVVQLVAALLGSRIIIDWHNLGYTILGLRLGAHSPLVKFAALLERIGGTFAFGHLFVTRAMRDHLREAWHLRGYTRVLYDRPGSHFRRSTAQETHTLFSSLSERLSQPMPGTLSPKQPGEAVSLPRVETQPLSSGLTGFWPPYSVPSSTPFTRRCSSSIEQHPTPPTPTPTCGRSPSGEDERLDLPQQLRRPSSPSLAGRRHAHLRPATPTSVPEVSGSSDEVVLRNDRPALAVSSTSWTADEDFDLLLSAVEAYECRAREVNSVQNTPALRLPKLLVVVTGKGDLRAHYERLIDLREQQEQYKWVRIRTAWLDPEEYPVLLGSADIGISLHSSSSGLDLPMKVVDMLGCGLPVLALDFACLDELVQEGRNGLKFSDAPGLTDALVSVLSGFPQSDTNSLRSGIALGGAFPSNGSCSAETWDQNWDQVVRPLLDAPPATTVESTQESAAPPPTPSPDFDPPDEVGDAALIPGRGTSATHVRTGDLRRRSGWNAGTTGSSPITPPPGQYWSAIPKIHVDERR